MRKDVLCVQALEDQNLFDSAEHRSRFAELIGCYCEHPFFTAGLCKCMYLSAWDMEHFIVMLDILNDLTAGKNNDTREMEDHGDIMIEEGNDRDKEILHLSTAFLTGRDYDPDMSHVDEEGKRILHYALQAAEVIDTYY